MDSSIQREIVETLQAAGADAVHTVTSYAAWFGERVIQVTVLDAGPLFRHRYELRLRDEAGLEIQVGPAPSVRDCLAAVEWEALLLG